MKIFRSLVAQLQLALSRARLRYRIRRLRRLQRRGLLIFATALAGKGGSVKIGANTVAEIEEWDYNPTADLIEKTPFLATSKSHIVGLMDGSGSFKGRHDQTDTNGQVAIRNAMLAGTQLTLLLYVDGTHKYTVPALIKGMPTKAMTTGAVEVQVDFQQDGDATYA